MQIKIMMWCHLTSTRVAFIKRQHKTNVGQNVEEREPCMLLTGMEIVLAIMENKMKFPQKKKK